MLPQLPSPPEIVQSLSETLLGGDSPSDSPSAEAPPLKDDDSASVKPAENGNGNGKDVAKNGNGNGKSNVSAEDAKKDQELETRFKSQILPKIQEQLKGLDQNEKPNAATIELKRQLRVGLSTLHPPPRTTVHGVSRLTSSAAVGHSLPITASTVANPWPWVASSMAACRVEQGEFRHIYTSKCSCWLLADAFKMCLRRGRRTTYTGCWRT